MKRREFLKTAALSTAAVTLQRFSSFGAVAEPLQAASSANAPSLMKRAYGKSGVQLSIIGFPGLMLSRLDQDASNRIVAEAFERGVCYFDVAPAYGNAEIKMGPALEPYRKKVILACKTKARTREGLEAELKRSLERLKTDYFDIYQMHHLVGVEKDVDVASRKGGAFEALAAAKKEGRIRAVGFSAHTIEAAMATLDRFEFDSVLFPFNFASFLKAGFGPQVMAKAIERGISRLAIKPGVRSKWTSREVQDKSPFKWMWYRPIEDRETAALSYRFTLSQPITAAMPPHDPTLFRMGLDIGMQFKPLTPEEEQKVKEIAQAVDDPLFPRPE